MTLSLPSNDVPFTLDWRKVWWSSRRTRRHSIKHVGLQQGCTGNAFERGVAEKSNTTPNHDTECSTSVAMQNAAVQQPLTIVSPHSNLNIVILQAEAGFVSKHNVVPFRCPCPPFIAPLAALTPVVSSQGLLFFLGRIKKLGQKTRCLPKDGNGLRLTTEFSTAIHCSLPSEEEILQQKSLADMSEGSNSTPAHG
ncbi:hypothetical protein TNCV_4000951 [Trichonephila clavipes]|nr:hypothetical protein TNCV_4000951 [Trichonephila clavipes]